MKLIAENIDKYNFLDQAKNARYVLFCCFTGMPINDGIDHPNPDDSSPVTGKDYIHENGKLSNPTVNRDNKNIMNMDEMFHENEMLENSSMLVKINMYKLVSFITILKFFI